MVFDLEFEYVYWQKIRKQLIFLVYFEFDDIVIFELGVIGFFNILGKYVICFFKRFFVCKSLKVIMFNGIWFVVFYIIDNKNYIQIYFKIGSEYKDFFLNI